MKPDTYFLSQQASLLPENSRERSLSFIALKGLRNTVFYYAPRLLIIEACFEPFLVWAHSKKLSMKWDLHIHLLEWLCTQSAFKTQIDDDLKKELLIAAVTRWSLSGMDHVMVKSLTVVSRHYPGIAVRVTKSRQPDEAGKVSILKMPDKLFPGYTSYAISYASEWSDIQWQPFS